MGFGGFLKKAALAPLKSTKAALSGHPIKAAKEAVAPLKKKKKPQASSSFGKALYGAGKSMPGKRAEASNEE